MKIRKPVGRPRLGDGAIRKSVSLSQEDWDKLHEWGAGNASYGVRRAILKAISWDGYLKSLRPGLGPT